MRPAYTILLCSLLLLAACQPAPSNPGQVAASQQAATQVIEVPGTEAVPQPISTAQAETPLAPTAALPSQSLDPLHFVFPTAGPAPVSAWRPPLYPVPWAPSAYDHFFFTRPIGADQVNWPLANYRYGGVFFANVVHTGVDIPAPKGTKVMAAGPGRVTWAGYGLYSQIPDDETDPYGLAVAIKHDFGYQGEALFTIYGHMDEIFVSRGQHLETGDIIGLVGETGKVTGPHLHFEVRMGKNNFYRSRNPELWMSPPQGWGVLAGHIGKTNSDPLPPTLVKIHNKDLNKFWEVMSYNMAATNSDPYYQENVVIGDLPAGNYQLWLNYGRETQHLDFKIIPGVVNYFDFSGMFGFTWGPPATPGPRFTPQPVSTTPTP